MTIYCKSPSISRHQPYKPAHCSQPFHELHKLYYAAEGRSSPSFGSVPGLFAILPAWLFRGLTLSATPLPQTVVPIFLKTPSRQQGNRISFPPKRIEQVVYITRYCRKIIKIYTDREFQSAFWVSSLKTEVERKRFQGSYPLCLCDHFLSYISELFTFLLPQLSSMQSM